MWGAQRLDADCGRCPFAARAGRRLGRWQYEPPANLELASCPTRLTYAPELSIERRPIGAATPHLPAPQAA